MGFLSFLSSKKPSARHSTGIKSQAYHATSPSLPPVRGTYPVAGNGPTNVFENLQRSHHKMSQSTLSLNAGSEASAPPPLVPRFQDSSVERPRTAPNGAGPMTRPLIAPGRGGREALKGPPLSFKKPRVESLSSTPVSSSGFQFAVQPRRQSEIPTEVLLPPPSAPFMQHNRHSSVQSMSLGKGFVDILDAQSEFKPLNFQSRVKAAGTRDYGEDVADRNIGVNGVDLESPQVQAFYASSTGGLYYEPNQSAPGPAISRTTYSDGEELFRPSIRNSLHDSSYRTQSLTSASLKTLPKRSSSFVPQELLKQYADQTARNETNPPQSALAGRRQSINSLVAFAPASSTPRSNSRPSSMHRANVRAAEGPSINQYRRPNTSYEKSSNELGIYSHPVPKATSTQPPPSSRLPRDSVVLAKKNYSLSANKTHTPLEKQSYEIRNPATPPRGSVPGSAFSSPVHKTPAKRHSMSSVTGEYPRHNDWSRNSKLEGGYDTRGWVGRVDVESSVDANLSSPAPSPHVMRTGHSRHDSGESQGLYQRTRSLASMSGKSKLDEIYEHIPMRTSSLRNWSISSTTPTFSSTSSNPFPRPQSRHTTNTSVDLPHLSSLMTSSRSSLNSGAGGFTSSHYTAHDSRLQTPLTSATSATGGFNIDDYLSSDDDIDADSFIVPSPRKKGEIEQELLFRDRGYGMDGLQLPGLFDSIPEIPTGTPQTVRHLRHSYSSPTRFSKRLSLDSRVQLTDYDLEDEEDDFEEDDYIIARADLVPGRRNTKRLSALGTMYQRIEEEKDEKIDVRTAIRMRKEAKAMKRARARLSRGKRTDVDVDVDEANHADVE